MWWRRKRQPARDPQAAVALLRAKYAKFRELLALNNDCLELIAGLQEDLQYVPVRQDVVAGPVSAIFQKAGGVVAALEELTGRRFALLAAGLRSQQEEIERHLAAGHELTARRLAADLSELGAAALPEAGGKAALLAEVKNRLGLPVPDGFVVTTEAYQQFCGIPLWTQVRDALRDADPDNMEALQAASRQLHDLVMAAPLPRAVEVAVSERARHLPSSGQGLAVRSSALGEGGDSGQTTYAGQFLTLLNVPPEGAVEAYRRVIAARFRERALSYRLSSGLLEVETPMAVLFLPIIPARASGIMYTRDPSDARSKHLWITATRGLGLDIASGRAPADLFVVSHQRPHDVLDRSIVAKQEELLAADGGLARRPLEAADAEAPSLEPEQIRTLAEYGIRLEEHFHGPQDVEWVVDEGGQCWILQTRPLALVQATRSRAKTRVREAPLAEGGRTVYPGRVSGPAHPVESREGIAHTPAGAIVFVPRASPEIVQLFPRIAGLVAEWGNLAGHAAALLREFRVPSVFLMTGALERVRSGEPVSLDAGQAKVYPGTLWETRAVRATPTWARPDRFKDPINRRLLTLNLVDPAAGDFRPSGCRSAHDVLRFCHESAVEAMFAVNDVIGEDHSHASKEFRTPIPLNVSVLDLGGGVTPEAQDARAVTPEQVVSRPFRALWRGLSHAKVSWVRDMPATLGDLASVMAGWLTPQDQGIRTLGEKSYVLVADEYLNLNSRLAYHFTLVDACLSDNPGINYISFRFAGGGATRQRRTFRARFIEACLLHHGFRVDRRGDLVNAWFKKAPAEQTEANLDILGRLIASSTHLDMYMASPEVMKWYVRQFLAGNYSFRPEQAPPPAVE